eukprot:150322-Chlamydomonas_euryale.AAC.6
MPCWGGGSACLAAWRRASTCKTYCSRPACKDPPLPWHVARRVAGHVAGQVDRAEKQIRAAEHAQSSKKASKQPAAAAHQSRMPQRARTPSR